MRIQRPLKISGNSTRPPIRGRRKLTSGVLDEIKPLDSVLAVRGISEQALVHLIRKTFGNILPRKPVMHIKPGTFPNSINPRGKGVIPVAILTTDTFDATTIDPTTVRFGSNGTEAAPVQSSLEDVDGDGDTDMILHFKTQDTGIVCGDTSASLTGETFGGQAIEGSDSIKTVGCK